MSSSVFCKRVAGSLTFFFFFLLYTHFSSFQPLTLAVDASPSTGSIGTPIAFSANAGGGSGNYASYDWDFGDQTAGGTGASTTHAYAKPGTYTARCTVHDAGGPVQSASVPVTITTVPLRLLPGVAWTSGIGGAEWRSDVSLFNPSTAGPMTVQVAFLDGTASIDSLADLAGKWKPVSIPARATRSFENVVSSIFGLGKGSYGAILVRADPLLAAQVVANGSTYDVSRGGDGTVGLSLPSVAFPNGASAGLLAAGGVVELIGLRDDATSHTNLAIANLYSDPATVEVTLWGANGARLGQPVSLTLNPFGVRQLTNVLTAPPGGGAGYDKVANPVSTYRARVRVVAGSALFPYASVIDDVSKDPVLVTGGAAPASSYRLPGMVRTEGRAGTLWRSDLVVYNPSASARSVRIAYSWVDGAGFSRSSVASVPFGPGQIIQWVDFVKLWLSIPAGSTDRYVDAFVDVAPDDSNADPLLVVSRVYNNQPSGDVGLGIPGYTAADFASGTGANRRLVMAGLRSDADFRSNVALFLPSAGGGLASGWLKIYAANGTMLTSTAIRLTDTSGFIQFSVDELVAEAGANHGALSVVVEDLVGQDVGGYATVIDNRSGDGTLFPGIPVP